MKKSELRQLIKEELTSILKEKKTKQLTIDDLINALMNIFEDKETSYEFIGGTIISNEEYQRVIKEAEDYINIVDDGDED
jgi:hypothetical protein